MLSVIKGLFMLTLQTEGLQISKIVSKNLRCCNCFYRAKFAHTLVRYYINFNYHYYYLYLIGT